MKVLIVNTSERTGGAAVAANRLMEALAKNGVDARMLVRDRQTDHPKVTGLHSRWLAKWHFLWERFMVFVSLRFSRQHLFDIDTANCGTDINRYKEFREADVIHLHWVNQGLLSLKVIRKILLSGKPVVWTMHDLWPASSLCHVALGCRRFTSGCHHCGLLPGGGSAHDLSWRVWQRKLRMLQGQSIIFVACSRWLEGEAKASALLRGQRFESIPNPIDARVFHPADQQQARLSEQLPADKQLLLFVCQRLTNPNKGMQYLVEACHQLASQYPDMKDNTGIVLLGGHADEVANQLPFATYPLGYVSDEQRIATIYNAVDLFMLPSLSENLPNTIMEAMACGVPSVGFKVGGIPEEIDHQKNGYVAAYRDAADLARGIHWTLFEADRKRLKQECLRKVARCYSPQSVALRYVEVYNEAIAMKHYKL